MLFGEDQGFKYDLQFDKSKKKQPPIEKNVLNYQQELIAILHHYLYEKTTQKT